MANDVTKVYSGPATVTYGATVLGLNSKVDIKLMGKVAFVENANVAGPTNAFWQDSDGIEIDIEITQFEPSVLRALFPWYGGSAETVSGGRNPGYDLTSSYQVLTIHPLQAGVSTAQDWTVYRAIAKAPPAVFQFDGKGKERGVKFTMVGLYDSTKSDGGLLWKYGDTADTTSPTYTISPTAGATGIAGSAHITLTFSEAMSKATLMDTENSVVTVWKGANASAVMTCTPTVSTVTYANDTLTLEPSENMSASGTFIVVVPDTIRDVAGNSLTASSTVSFTISA